MGHRRRGRPDIQGFATDISVNAGSRSTSRSTPTHATTPSTSTGSAGTRASAPGRSPTSLRRAFRRTSPQCITDVGDRALRLRQLGGLGVVERAGDRGVRCLHRTADPAGHRRARATSRSSSATTRSHSDVVFQTSDTTWQAYNTYGGSDFYQGGANGRAYKISYNRPFITRGEPAGRDFFFATEYPMVRFLERNGYDVSYIGRRRHRPPRRPLLRTTRSSCPSGTTSTGAARSAPTSRPPATPA